MPPYSNADEVDREIERLLDGIGFTTPGRDESIGKDIVATVAHGIADMCANQVQATNEAFPDNEESYADYKSREYGMHPPAFGFRTGQTFSLESLVGDTSITRDTIEMRYGTDRVPDRASGGSIKPADRRATDREKMGWLMEKYDIHVYEVGPLVLDDVMQGVREGVAEYFRSKGV